MTSALDVGNGRECVLTEARFAKQRSTGTIIAYLPAPQYDEWMVANLSPVRRELYAEQAANGNPAPRALATNYEEKIGDVTLPPNSVIIRRPEKLNTLENRIRLGQALKHELTHTQGGNEIEACLAHRDYLRKQGLKGATDKEVLKSIALGPYSLNEFREALAKIEGRTSNWMRVMYKYLEARYTGTRYWVKEDLERAVQNNTINRTASRRLS
jgi:hypothetical protein